MTRPAEEALEGSGLAGEGRVSDGSEQAAVTAAVLGVDDPVDEPDIGFTLGAAAPVPDIDPATRARQLTHRIARELAAAGPRGWRRLDAVFALTVATEVVHVFFATDESTVRVQPPQSVLGLIREHRALAARLGDGPWWRMLVSLDDSGKLEADYDYGDVPFPDDYLFPAPAYRADLAEYPRTRLPVWLAAYVNHDGRQTRSPRTAFAQAGADRAAEVAATVADNEFPPFPLMWARWAVIAATFVGAESQWGPRVLPSLAWFEGAKRSGSTLYALPGGRAVLSGGVWDAPTLDAVYNAGAPMPRFYAGAPEWVANPVVNPRAANGLLSFCYWWENGHWYRGESPSATELASALPGMWTVETVVDLVSRLVAEQPTEQQRASVASLVSAAEAAAVSRDHLVETFGDTGSFDIDSALYQLTMAGVTVATR
ncbi:Uncharacterised protein [Nocardia otitidiscaviarum]|uniref:Uncharacterized protein n=1 Tax=Nocardia otitidiscaviarum TaxID=1823 RepID=A0A378YHH1_9NOCA|nr:hypothetical protein [Nocardia otitidiscaviarum]SUA76612.1 Uncharacterised protein [Nocardia otitidiscaviarum]